MNAEGAPSNALLAHVPRTARARLTRRLEPVLLALGDVLYEGQPINHVYFPLDCVISLFAPLVDRLAVEVGMVGREGMVGVPLALGVRTSSVHAVVQGAGSALRMGASSFQRELRENAALRAAVHRYIHTLMGQHTQTAACNAFHPIEARCARWLSMTRDRLRSDEVNLTHAFLARMLGVRRVGVTVAAGNLQRMGLITYSRGHIAILEPQKLAAAACECYGVANELYARTFDRPLTA